MIYFCSIVLLMEDIIMKKEKEIFKDNILDEEILSSISGGSVKNAIGDIFYEVMVGLTATAVIDAILLESKTIWEDLQLSDVQWAKKKTTPIKCDALFNIKCLGVAPKKLANFYSLVHNKFLDVIRHPIGKKNS